MMMMILTAVVVLGVLVFVHELGHFLVAKRARVGVLKFSLGFGPKLVGVKRGETEYLISALPLGGYVKMIGEDPTDESPEAADPERSFSKKSVGVRSLIILAGPLSNILLPVLIFWGIFTFVGQAYRPPVMGVPEAGSPAAKVSTPVPPSVRPSYNESTYTVKKGDTLWGIAKRHLKSPLRWRVLWKENSLIANPNRIFPGTKLVLSRQEITPTVQIGLLAGDKIVVMDGRPIERWDEVESAIHASSGKALGLTILRDGRTFQVTLESRAQKTRDIFGEEIEVWDLGLRPLISTRIGQVLPGQVAQQAGVRSGDRVVAAGGAPVAEWDQLAKIIHASPGKPLVLTIERDGQRQDIEVTPRPTRQPGPGGEEEIGLVGIGPAPESQYRRLNPVSALAAGAARTVDLSVLVVQGFVKLVQAKISPKTIGGTILIAQMTGEVAQRGLMELLSFTALLSINLAILNLLPIPILDGGHLFFALIECLRGKPVSLRKRELAQQVGMVLLVALMLFASYNDILRWMGWQ